MQGFNALHGMYKTSLRDQGARQGFPKIVQDVANGLFLNRWSRVPFGNNSICRMATTALETPYFPRRGAHALKKKNLRNKRPAPPTFSDKVGSDSNISWV